MSCVRKSQWKCQKPDWITFLPVQWRALSSKSVSVLSKVSIRIFASVADGIKRPRDTNVIFIANQAPCYFRLVYAPSTVFSDQKAFYRRNRRKPSKTTNEGKETENRREDTGRILFCTRYSLPCFYFIRTMRTCGKKSMSGKWKREKWLKEKER